MTNPLFELERAIAHLRFNPKPEDERLEELRQQYETVLTLLESEFLGAILSGDWSEFDQFLDDFRGQASTKDLSRPGADSLQRPTEPIVKD